MSLFLLPKVINTHNTDTNDIQTLLRPSESIIHRYSLSSLNFNDYKLNLVNINKFQLRKSKSNSEIQDFILFITNERLILYHINFRIGVYVYILSMTSVEQKQKKTTSLIVSNQYHDGKYTLIGNKQLIEFIKHEFFCGVCLSELTIKNRVSDSKDDLKEIDCFECGSHLDKNDMYLYRKSIVHENNINREHMVCSKCTHDNSEYFQDNNRISNNCKICEHPLLFIDIPVLTEIVTIALKTDEPINNVIHQLLEDTKKIANLSKMNTNSMNLLKLLNTSSTDPLEMGIKSIINKYDEDIKRLDFLHDVTLSTMSNFLESTDDIDEYLHLTKKHQKSHLTIADFFIKNEYKVIKMNDLYYLYNFEIFQYKYMNCQDFIDIINVNDMLEIYDYNNVSYVINKEFEKEYISHDHHCGNSEFDDIIKDKLTYDGCYLIDLDSSNTATYYYNNGH